MNEIRKISKKRIFSDKSQSVFIIVTVLLSIATITSALSMSISYLRFYKEDAPQLLDMSEQEVKLAQAENVIEMFFYMGDFLEYFRTGVNPDFNPEKDSEDEIYMPPPAKNSEAVFSPRASVENLPLTVTMLTVIVFASVFISLSVIFSVTKRTRRNFYATLIISGASDKMVKKCVFFDSVYYCAAAALPGLAIGIVQTYLTKAAASTFFENLQQKYDGISGMPVDIRFSFVSYAASLLLVFAVVFLLSLSAVRKMSVKNAATEIRKKIVTEIGKCTFTEKPKKYIFPGVEYYISFRNFNNNIGKYLRIMMMCIIYISMMGISIIIFNVIRNYNNYTALNHTDEFIGFSYAFQTYFCALSVIAALITVFSTFSALTANINANLPVFVLMRSAGASIKSVLRCVRLESLLCTVLTLIFSIFTVFFFNQEITLIYRDDPGISVGVPGIPVLISTVLGLVFVLSVVVSVILGIRKLKKMNLVCVLKEFLY